jgi:mono/diheme cytochrome c family protein
MRAILFAAAHATAALIEASGANAQVPAEAFRRGCAGCHTSERPILRRIPKAPEAERRAWIEKFMTQHPCERDDLKPLIVDYLLERSRP